MLPVPKVELRNSVIPRRHLCRGGVAGVPVVSFHKALHVRRMGVEGDCTSPAGESDDRGFAVALFLRRLLRTKAFDLRGEILPVPG